MAKRAIEMRPAQIAALKPKHKKRPTTYNVGGITGLQIQVQPSGNKSWLLRIVIGGKRREIGLGAYPDTGLAAARDKARDLRDRVANGADPVAERQAAKAAVVVEQKRRLPFSKAMESYLVAKVTEFRNEKHKAQWRSTLATYAAPLIGSTDVAEIDVKDVQRVLMQDVTDKAGNIEGALWLVRTETASRLRGRIEGVLAWATVAGHRTGDNPARWKGNLDAVMPKPGKVAKVDNQPALSLDDLPAFTAALAKREGLAARALELGILCASRSGEVRGAEWSEIDLEAALWTIPAARMKMKREHRVPLSKAAVALLEGLERRDDSPYVFPAVRGGMLSDMTLSAVMRRMHESEPGRWLDRVSKRPAVPHGFRSTFRDWAAEKTEFPRDMAEIALAHNVGSEVERAYRRGDMLEKRRAMMAEWADFCLSQQKTPIPS